MPGCSKSCLGCLRCSYVSYFSDYVSYLRIVDLEHAVDYANIHDRPEYNALLNDLGTIVPEQHAAYRELSTPLGNCKLHPGADIRQPLVILTAGLNQQYTVALWAGEYLQVLSVNTSCNLVVEFLHWIT